MDQILVWILIIGACAGNSGGQDNWFEAATYVVTQDALDEAPYRYAKFLDEGLKKLEQQDFPMISNGDPCDIRYRLGPAQERSKLTLLKDTIKVRHRCPVIRLFMFMLF